MRVRQERSQRTVVLAVVAVLHAAALWWLALVRGEPLVPSEPPMVLTLWPSPPAGGGSLAAEAGVKTASAPSAIHLPPVVRPNVETLRAPLAAAAEPELIVGAATTGVLVEPSVSPVEGEGAPSAPLAQAGAALGGLGLAGQGTGTGAGIGSGSGPGQGLNVEARLIRHLTLAEKREVYPVLAARRGIHGRAVILCRVHRDTTLSRCRPDSETPAGQGFGRAAVRASAYMRMQPRVVGGVPQDGARERITVHFVWSPAVSPEEAAPR